MTYFLIIVAPAIMGMGLIWLGLRISPLIIALGVMLLATTWLFG